MKVRVFLFLLIISSSLSLHAQQFKGLVNVGINTSQIDGDGLGGFYKSGLMLGGGVALQFHERCRVSVCAEFMGKGSRTAFKDSVNYFRWKMQYIDIPLALSFKLHERFSFQVELTPSVLINDKVDAGLGFQASNPKNDAFHYLAAGGVEFFPIENMSLLMRYQYSLTRFNGGVDNTVPKFHRLISVGLRFYLKSAQQ
jgi:opacity protein-like surface antigen